MYIQHSASAGFQLTLRVQAIFATLAHAVKTFWSDTDAAQSDATDSKLEQHLQYDVGEIDCDPLRSKSRPDQFRLWLHYPR